MARICSMRTCSAGCILVWVIAVVPWGRFYGPQFSLDYYSRTVCAGRATRCHGLYSAPALLRKNIVRMSSSALIIDDHPPYRDALVQLLGTILGDATVRSASCAEEALRMAAQL